LTATSESDYSDLQIAVYPKIFINNQSNNLTFIISSPTGKLINYSLGVSAPGGSNQSTGNLATGETLNLKFNITNANLFDKVNINYSYTTTTGGTKTYTYSYGIIGPMNSASNYTIANIKLRDYGMGMFEKGFLTMIAVILLAGFAYMAMGIGGALAVGLIIEGVAVFIGFLPVSSVLISFLVGVIILVASSVGGKS
jgi:hypothetical protein